MSVHTMTAPRSLEAEPHLVEELEQIVKTNVPHGTLPNAVEQPASAH